MMQIAIQYHEDTLYICILDVYGQDPPILAEKVLKHPKTILSSYDPTSKIHLKALHFVAVYNAGKGWKKRTNHVKTPNIAFARRFSAMACCFSSREGHRARLKERSTKRRHTT